LAGESFPLARALSLATPSAGETPATNKGQAEIFSILLMYEADLVGNVMGKLYRSGIHCLYAFRCPVGREIVCGRGSEDHG